MTRATGSTRPPTSDVPQDDVIGVVVAGRDIALYGVDGEVFATDNICTHGHARLCEGFLEGHEIECPLHQGRFDVRTGMPTCAPADRGDPQLPGEDRRRPRLAGPRLKQRPPARRPA